MSTFARRLVLRLLGPDWVKVWDEGTAEKWRNRIHRAQIAELRELIEAQRRDLARHR